MEKASKIHFNTDGLRRTGGGILDHASAARPMNHAISPIPGTDYEMGAALALRDEHGVPLIEKVFFHDEFRRAFFASEFIQDGLSARYVIDDSAKSWLQTLPRLASE